MRRSMIPRPDRYSSTATTEKSISATSPPQRKAMYFCAAVPIDNMKIVMVGSFAPRLSNSLANSGTT